MSSIPFTRRRFIGSTLALSGGLALSACGGGGDAGGGSTAPAAEKVTQAQIDEAMNTDTTLTFWSWVPDLQNEVDLFEKKYPKVKVKLVNVGSGAAHYQKMRAAIQSGQGAPDVTQVEYPVHSLVHPGRQPAGYRSPRRRGDQEPVPGLGLVPGEQRASRSTASRRTSDRWACCTARTC